MTGVQKRMEPRRSLLGASVDVTEARRAKLLKAEEISDHGQRPW